MKLNYLLIGKIVEKNYRNSENLMNKKCVILPIETTSRELNSKILLACKLAEKGINVFFGTKELAQKISFFLGNVIYIDKGYHKKISEKIYKNLRENRCSIILLDEENGVDLEDFNMLDYRIPDHIVNWFDLIFLWGTKQKQYLKKNRNNFDTNKFVITGHPRFDLLTKDYLKLYEKKIRKIKKKYSEFVLFATDNKFANNINPRDQVIRNYIDRYKDLKYWIDYSDNLMDKNIKLIKEIYNKTNLNIIIRPHPEEEQLTYKEIFRNFTDRVFTIYDDSSIFWILSAKYVLINHSTTGIESTMLNKPTFSFTPLKLKKNSFPFLPIRCSENFQTISQLLNRFDVEKPGKKFKKVFKDFFTFDYFSPSSSESICSIILKKYKFKFTIFTYIKVLLFSLALSYFKFKSLVKNKLSNHSNDKLTQNKLSDMNSKIIIQRFKEISMEAKTKNVKIKEIDKHLYFIKASNIQS